MSKKYSNAPRIGEIYSVYFSGTGSEQQGWRPGLVFQNNVGNAYSPNIIVLPLTSSIKKTRQPTHVFVPCSQTGLKVDSLILCENPERVSKQRLGRYITTLPEKYMSEVAEASLLASSVIAYIEPEVLLVVWQRSLSLNDIKPPRATEVDYV